MGRYIRHEPGQNARGKETAVVRARGFHRKGDEATEGTRIILCFPFLNRARREDEARGRRRMSSEPHYIARSTKMTAATKNVANATETTRDHPE